jgi:hypothetical protein
MRSLICISIFLYYISICADEGRNSRKEVGLPVIAGLQFERTAYESVFSAFAGSYLSPCKLIINLTLLPSMPSLLALFLPSLTGSHENYQSLG